MRCVVDVEDRPADDRVVGHVCHLSSVSYLQSVIISFSTTLISGGHLTTTNETKILARDRTHGSARQHDTRPPAPSRAPGRPLHSVLTSTNETQTFDIKRSHSPACIHASHARGRPIVLFRRVVLWRKHGPTCAWGRRPQPPPVHPSQHLRHHRVRGLLVLALQACTSYARCRRSQRGMAANLLLVLLEHRTQLISRRLALQLGDGRGRRRPGAAAAAAAAGAPAPGRAAPGRARAGAGAAAGAAAAAAAATRPASRPSGPGRARPSSRPSASRPSSRPWRPPWRPWPRPSQPQPWPWRRPWPQPQPPSWPQPRPWPRPGLGGRSAGLGGRLLLGRLVGLQGSRRLGGNGRLGGRRRHLHVASVQANKDGRERREAGRGHSALDGVDLSVGEVLRGEEVGHVLLDGRLRGGALEEEVALSGLGLRARGPVGASDQGTLTAGDGLLLSLGELGLLVAAKRDLGHVDVRGARNGRAGGDVHRRRVEREGGRGEGEPCLSVSFGGGRGADVAMHTRYLVSRGGRRDAEILLLAFSVSPMLVQFRRLCACRQLDCFSCRHTSLQARPTTGTHAHTRDGRMGAQPVAQCCPSSKVGDTASHHEAAAVLRSSRARHSSCMFVCCVRRLVFPSALRRMMATRGDFRSAARRR